jgi:hypothetical protein
MIKVFETERLMSWSFPCSPMGKSGNGPSFVLNSPIGDVWEPPSHHKHCKVPYSGVRWAKPPQYMIRFYSMWQMCSETWLPAFIGINTGKLPENSVFRSQQVETESPLGERPKTSFRFEIAKSRILSNHVFTWHGIAHLNSISNKVPISSLNLEKFARNTAAFVSKSPAFLKFRVMKLLFRCLFALFTWNRLSHRAFWRGKVDHLTVLQNSVCWEMFMEEIKYPKYHHQQLYSRYCCDILRSQGSNWLDVGDPTVLLWNQWMTEMTDGTSISDWMRKYS